MKQTEVRLGTVYAVKVNGVVRPVRITAVHTRERFAYGTRNQRRALPDGYVGVNLITGREVHLRSAAKLRYEYVEVNGKWARKREEVASETQTKTLTT